MAFEVYTVDRSKPGFATITRTGLACFALLDLKAMGIAKSAVVMIDRDMKRLAIRATRGGEAGMTVMQGTTARHVATINLGGAMKAIGFPTGKRQCRVPVTRKNDLLIVELESPKN